MLLALLLACSTPEPAAAYGDSEACDEAVGCAPACTPLAAVFFDLGGTLVLEQESGLFREVPDARPLVAALRDQGLPVGVITNVERDWTIEDLEALLEDPSLLALFDVILLSSEAESRPKPDPRIYAEALALLPNPPAIQHTAFVTEEIGDIADAEPPERGARAAGMIGVLVSDDAPDPLANHAVATEALLSIASAPWLACIEAE